MGIPGARSRLRQAACWIAVAAAIGASGSAVAATSASGQGYGLNVTANILGLGLGVPVANTGQRTAPPNFNASQSAVSANVSAGALLTVNTGVVNGAAQSALAMNTVSASGGVNGLNLGLVNAALIPVSILGVTADTVGSNVQVSCVGGNPVATGTSTLTNLQIRGLLGPISVPANPAPNTGLSVLGVASITLNEQLPSANKLIVNALHISIDVLGLIKADVVVGHSEASMPNCAAAPGSVSISVPPINTSNQAAVPVTGQCTAGGGLVQIATNPVGGSASATCSPSGTYSTTVNATALLDGTITFIATQDAVSANTQVSKNTAVATPVVTVNTPPPVIAKANAAQYGATPPVFGTCTSSAGSVSVTVGGVPASPVACNSGAWTLAPQTMNVSSLADGNVEIRAQQGTGQGAAFAIKDTTAPAVAITTAPSINAANVASYTFGGSCSEHGAPVNISLASPAQAVTSTCTGGSWSVTRNMSGLNEGNVTITAAQTDIYGNTTTPPASRTVLKDVTPPVVTVNSPAVINAGNQNSYNVSGACTAGDGPVSVTIGSLPRSAPCTGSTGNSGTWSIAGIGVSGLPQGSVQITAKQTDAAGNQGTGQAVANKTTPAGNDTTPPVVTVIAPPIDENNQNGYQPSGTCEAGASDVTVVIGAGLPGAVTVMVPCKPNGTWTAPPTDVSGLPLGPITLIGSQTDSSNNTGTGQAQTTKSTLPGDGAFLTPVPVGGLWAGLLLLVSGLGFLRRRKG